MTDRRTFIGAMAALVGAMPHVAQAQPGKVPRIGFLGNGDPTSGEPQLKAFHQGLRELGWIEGRTFTIVYRWAEGDSARLPALVAELVQAKVDVIVLSGTPAIAAAQRATSTIPVVFVLLVDPVAMGFVQTLARPGGNMTGLASQFDELITKQLQLLKEAVPNLTRVALLRHVTGSPSDPGGGRERGTQSRSGLTHAQCHHRGRLRRRLQDGTQRAGRRRSCAAVAVPRRTARAPDRAGCPVPTARVL